MRKSKKSLALIAALLGMGSLAGCDSNIISYSTTGKIVSYGSGENDVITADMVYDENITSSSSYQQIFNAIKSIVVRNYFAEDHTVTYYDGNGTKQTKTLGKKEVTEAKGLYYQADEKVINDHKAAQKKADEGTSTYQDAMDEIYKSHGAKNDDELRNHYLDELKEERFDENFYEYKMKDISSGHQENTEDNIPATEDTKLQEFWTGYFKDMAPYHVSHILVKLSDGSSTNYHNGTISEDDCEKLYNVIQAMSAGDDGESFGVIASKRSDDEGSAAKFGDLGIMDYSTGFVPEFKLGIYAYENEYSSNVAAATAAGSQIAIPDYGDTNGIYTQFSTAAQKTFNITDPTTQIPTVEFSTFKNLVDYKDVDEREDQEKVMGGSSLVFPRNTIYNRDLNRHSFAFVKGTETTNFTKEGKAGFHTFVSGDPVDSKLVGQTLLSVKVNGLFQPVLMVRAGTSDYQGIHFIVINRSPFTETDAFGVTTEEYYTTYNVDQSRYPVYTQSDVTNTVTNRNGAVVTKGELKPTYANFNLELNDESTESRTKELYNKLKGYDSDKLSKYILKAYMLEEGIQIKDDGLREAFDRWMNASVENAKNEADKTWRSDWTNYIGTLRTQNTDREQLLMSVASMIGFEEDYQLDAEMTIETFSTYVNGLATDGLISSTEATSIIDAVKAVYGNNATDKFVLEDLFNKRGGIFNDGETHK